MDVEEVAQEMGFSVPYVYKLIRHLNERLKEKGCVAKQYGVDEKLKAENQMQWVWWMNMIRHQADEIVKHELIYF